MFWWEKAALAARGWKPATDKARVKGTRRFGFITTNSLRQTFNRKVLDPHLNDEKAPLSLVFAIPDHPWVDAGEGAAVRIAMTVAEAGRVPGRLLTITEERKGETEAEGRPVVFQTEKGKVFADLRIGADVAAAKPLRANEGLAYQGVTPLGEGFRVSRPAASVESEALAKGILRRYLNGKQFVAGQEPGYIIDFYGLSEGSARAAAPHLYQQILDLVRPERAEKKRATYRDSWWVFAEPRSKMRAALSGLPRFVATCRTAKHRVFGFLDGDILPDAKLIAVALREADALAVLSSRHHVIWAISSGAWLGVGNDANYNHAQCFNPFPFPDPTNDQKARLRNLGEQLDAHRKAQQAVHPKLTLTGMYNVLEKLRAKERIDGKDREIYDQGLVGILKDIHDQIDCEVAAAYGWPEGLSNDEILHRLVDLNRTRAAEEARGLVRWLRPDYQNPQGRGVAAKGEQGALDIGPAVSTEKTPWPKTLPEQIAAVRAALHDLGEASPEQVARRFQRGQARSIQPLLESLTALGQARVTETGRFAA
ncbi:hypothetical protein LHP98_19150 [Rhodobacter sp. Har01]|uniref:type IIL restriction-modification enzyme MmeI n=1 Tax=Rhodobacter sp. Har01 TaxID=2883999 RepID=UPI001D08ECE5|nr:type IIL restriction-modification enzyme MmeI [Rhodobacter sp. Har01]MCB6180228.1 hypothetical protein [Rhodobacter sp. Har01]